MERLSHDPPAPDADASFASLHSPLGRLLPPLRHTARGALSSLHTVETYFGAELSPKMVDVAGRLSEKQLDEIEGRMDWEGGQTRSALRAKRASENEEERFLTVKPWWRRSHSDRQVDKLLGIRANELAKIISKSPWAQRPHILKAAEISTHEEMLAPEEQQDIGNKSMLKHLALYCQHTAIRDPLQQTTALYLAGLSLNRDRNSQNESNERLFSTPERRRRFANGLRQLLPIAPLVRDGTFILVADQINEDETFGLRFTKTDPFLAWILSRYRPEMSEEIEHLASSLKVGPEYDSPEDNEQRNQIYDRISELDSEAQAVVRRRYPYHVSDQTWNRLMTVTRWMHRYSLAPVTSDPAIGRHLAQIARIELEGQPNLRGNSQVTSPIATAASYQIPSLNDTLFSQITRLRGSSLFDDIRRALRHVAEICSQSAPHDYESYQRTVGECSQDILGPLYAKVDAQRRRNRWATLGITATGEVMDLQIGGIAGKVVGAAFKRAGSRSPKRRHEEANIACGVLKSVLLHK